MKIIKPTQEQKDQHIADGGVYPLHLLCEITQGDVTLTAHIEDLRSWAKPDPQWECRLPDGHKFCDDCHGSLELTLQDAIAFLRDTEKCAGIEKCSSSPSCGCEFAGEGS